MRHQQRTPDPLALARKRRSTRGLTLVELLLSASLGIVMLGAAVWHLSRGEATQIVLNLINAAILGFIGYGRQKLHPLEAR